MASLLLITAGVDLHEAKESISIALVESIFRRAGYGVRRLMGDRPSARRPATEEFTPSFYLSGAETYGEFPIAVAYRPFLEAYGADYATADLARPLATRLAIGPKSRLPNSYSTSSTSCRPRFFSTSRAPPEM